jgi:hypothetical protein
MNASTRAGGMDMLPTLSSRASINRRGKYGIVYDISRMSERMEG